MANLAARTASLGLTGPQTIQSSIFGGTGMMNQVGSWGGINNIASLLSQQQQQEQAAMQAQISASAAANQDPNNASATGFSSMGGEMYADPSAQLATGNAPNNTITAGMAMGNAPIATVGGFNPSATATAEGIYGSEIARSNSISPKKLITL